MTVISCCEISRVIFSISSSLLATSLSTSSANFHRQRLPSCRQTAPSSCGVQCQPRACLDVDAWPSSGRLLPPSSLPLIFTSSGQHSISRHHRRKTNQSIPVLMSLMISWCYNQRQTQFAITYQCYHQPSSQHLIRHFSRQRRNLLFHPPQLFTLFQNS